MSYIFGKFTLKYQEHRLKTYLGKRSVLRLYEYVGVLRQPNVPTAVSSTTKFSSWKKTVPSRMLPLLPMLTLTLLLLFWKNLNGGRNIKFGYQLEQALAMVLRLIPFLYERMKTVCCFYFCFFPPPLFFPTFLYSFIFRLILFDWV